MDELEIGIGPATELLNRSRLSYHSLDALHGFLRIYGRSGVIDCLKEMAREAVRKGEPADLLFADRTAYLARSLKNRDFVDICDAEARLLDEVALKSGEIDEISRQLREIHAEFSYFWYRIQPLVKPRYFPDERGNRIGSALREDWGARKEFDAELLETILYEFLHDVLRRADLAPEKSSFHCAWVLVPGAYLEFSELTDLVPELEGKSQKTAELLPSKEKLMTELDALNWDRVYASKKSSDYLWSMQQIIHAVGLDNLAAQLDRIKMHKGT